MAATYKPVKVNRGNMCNVRKTLPCKDIGVAAELYSVIARDYLSSGQPVNMSGKWEPVLKYLEMKGYIVSHENCIGEIFAIPAVKIRA